MPFLLSQTSIPAHHYLANSMVMSGDGRLVAYVAAESAQAGAVQQVWIHDNALGVTRSLGMINPALDRVAALQPSLSADGSTIAFVIKSTGQVAVLTIAGGAMQIVSAAGDGTPGNGVSGAPALSANGRRVVFESAADKLLAGDSNGVPDVFVRDLQNGTLTRIAGSDTVISQPQISADGGTVLWLDKGLLYAGDVASGQRQLASSAYTNINGTGLVMGAYELSADGKYAVYAEHIAAPGHFDSRHGVDVYRRDLASGEVDQVVVRSQYVPGEALPFYTSNDAPEVSADGGVVTYLRTWTYTPDNVDFFIHDLARGETDRFSMPADATGRVLAESSLSPDGSHFAYVFQPTGDGSPPAQLRIAMVLRGTAAPGQGDQAILGGAGVDVLSYAGGRAQYVVAGQTVSDSLDGRNGTDTLTGVERLRFDDGNIALDTAGVAGQAFRLYQAAFDRAPDEQGAGFWIHAMDEGASLLSVSESFVASAEFKAEFGNAPTSAQLVHQLYENILHRAGDAGGVTYWTGLLDTGRASLPEVLIGFSESAENVAALVGVLQGGVHYQPFG